MKKTKIILPILLLLAVAVFAVACFSACVDADYTVQRAKLEGEDYGYTVNVQEGFESVAGCAWCLTAAKNEEKRDEYEYVRIFYFRTEDDAIEFYHGGEFEARLERLENDPQFAFLGGVSHRRIGSIVLYGTEGGVEDALA